MHVLILNNQVFCCFACIIFLPATVSMSYLIHYLLNNYIIFEELRLYLTHAELDSLFCAFYCFSDTEPPLHMVFDKCFVGSDKVINQGNHFG